uniref:Macro domain protein n=2 Tax=unclassified bacterial viruses TaxID=12333 RepID=A0AAU6VYA7_9VIRU
MINYKVGDVVDAILSGEVIAIGHQANCFNTMNSGVAKAIRTRLPCAWEADQLTVKGDRDKLGTISVGQLRNCLTGEPTGLVYNLYGQYNYGYDNAGYTDYHALTKALIAMRDDLLTGNNLTEVGFPKIGAGLGGGDWSIISTLIADVFCDSGFNVTIYTLE